MKPNYNYVQGNQVQVIPGDTDVHPLFAGPTPALSAVILPLRGNTGDPGPLVDLGLNAAIAADPINEGGLALDVLPNGRHYDLAALKIKAANGTDGVLVIYFN